MDPDPAGAVVPYVTAAVAAYGAAVVDRVRDAAADATVSRSRRAGMDFRGRRLLQWGGYRPSIVTLAGAR